MSVIKFIVGFVIGIIIGGIISNNLAVQMFFAMFCGVVFAFIGNAQRKNVWEEENAEIEEWKKEIINNSNMGMYKDNVTTGRIQYDSELRIISNIVGKLELYARSYKENVDKHFKSRIKRDRYETGRCAHQALLQIKYSFKFTDEEIDSCLTKLHILGELINDARVDDLTSRIENCIRQRNDWQSDDLSELRAYQADFKNLNPFA